MRSPVIWPRHHAVRVLRFTRLHARTPDYWPKELRLLGAWRLTSANSGFGGYSDLLATDGGTLTAINDVADTLRMGRPDTQPDALPQFGRVHPLAGRIHGLDIEAATWDPQTGVRWLAYEGMNLIRRIKPGRNGTGASWPT